jgi:hypothetical protein
LLDSAMGFVRVPSVHLNSLMRSFVLFPQVTPAPTSVAAAAITAAPKATLIAREPMETFRWEYLARA